MRYVVAALSLVGLSACTSSVSVPENVTVYEVPQYSPPTYDVPPATPVPDPVAGGDAAAAAATGAVSLEGAQAVGAELDDDRINLNAYSQEQQKIDREIAEQQLAEARSQLVIVPTTGVPNQVQGANIALYAQQSKNEVGTKVYRRSFGSMVASGCRRYSTDDEAQRAFLANGGPEEDPLRLDADGDGFACDWDPAPYRELGS